MGMRLKAALAAALAIAYAFRKGTQDPAYAAVLARVDQEAAYLNTEDYARHALAQIDEQRKLIEELGLKTQ